MVVFSLKANELHYVERGELLQRRKVIYEELHPETRQGANGNKGGKILENDTMSFSADAAEKTGESRRTIEREIQIANSLTDRAKEAKRY